VRVLHVIPSLGKAGAERLLLDIVRSQRLLSGFTVELVVLSDCNAYKDEYPDIKPIPVPSYVRPSLVKPWQYNLEGWKALIRNYKPDIIHSHLFKADFFVHFQPEKGVKYVTHGHDNMRQLQNMQTKHWINKRRIVENFEKRFLLKQYSQSNTHFIAVSQDTEAYFKEVLPNALHSNIHLLTNAINYKTFAQKTSKWPEDGIRKLVNVGSFVSKKNQSFLVEVMQHLVTGKNRYELFLLGDGPMRGVLENQIKERNLNKFIHLPGIVSNVEEYYWKSHAMIHAATYEPFGLVLIEGMAAGLPLITLDGKGNRFLREALGQRHFLASDISPVDFANYVETCFETEENWRSQSQKARLLSRRFDIEAYVDKLKDLYFSL